MWGGVRVVFGVQRQVLLPLGTLDTCRASWLVPCSPIPAAGVGVGGGSPFSLKVKWCLRQWTFPTGSCPSSQAQGAETCPGSCREKGPLANGSWEGLGLIC